MKQIEILAEAIHRLNNDERAILCDLMYPIGLKLTGVPESEPDSLFLKRNICENVISSIEKIQLKLAHLTQEELRELNGLIASDGLKFFNIAHKIDYTEP